MELGIEIIGIEFQRLTLRAIPTFKQQSIECQSVGVVVVTPFGELYLSI